MIHSRNVAYLQAVQTISCPVHMSTPCPQQYCWPSLATLLLQLAQILQQAVSTTLSKHLPLQFLAIKLHLLYNNRINSAFILIDDSQPSN